MGLVINILISEPKSIQSRQKRGRGEVAGLEEKCGRESGFMSIFFIKKKKEFVGGVFLSQLMA